MTANNPAIIALQEARLLWPDQPVDVMLSLGVGVAPPVRRERGSTFVETGSILIESRWGRGRGRRGTTLPAVGGGCLALCSLP